MNNQTQAAETGLPGDKAWAEFADNPLSYMHPDRLSNCLGSALPDGLCMELLSNLRLKSRLSGIVASHYDLPPLSTATECSEKDRAIALAPIASLEQIVLFAGAIYWSSAIVNTVRSSEVVALQSQIGDELCAFAVRHRELAGPMRNFESFDNTADRVLESGWHCFNAWCMQIDPAISARIRLKLAPNEMPVSSEVASYADIGPAIIRQVGAEVL